MAAYLNTALEEDDASIFAAALGDIARVEEITRLSRETGIDHKILSQELSPTGHPSFDTVPKVVKAFGLKLDVAVSA